MVNTMGTCVDLLFFYCQWGINLCLFNTEQLSVWGEVSLWGCSYHLSVWQGDKRVKKVHGPEYKIYPERGKGPELIPLG